jgi:dipeptidyl aminopeptidase/acylaminoacyl peptidase
VWRNITAAISTSWTLYDNDYPDASGVTAGPLIWLKGDAGVLLYDHNDIWIVDPTNQKFPVNLTQGYGRQHHLSIRLAERSDRPLETGQSLLLTAINRDTEDNGFLRVTLGRSGSLQLLTMGPYSYEIRDDYSDTGEAPIKASAAAAYIVQRMSATEAQNYFYTTDFKSFKPLSDLHPQSQYNWPTTELVTWTLPDGRPSKGVLYKPEDFDPAKRYPLILYYYEKLSNQLNVFPEVRPSYGPLNIASFVSNGYLVFTPDIHYRLGQPGASALDCVVSAAQALAQRPYVDAHHMGIQGHSFGGYETNYIVTHSELFAAAVSASGVSDVISHFGALWGGVDPTHAYYEASQGRLGAPPWERPELYVENSPVFKADQVTTPLLLMNNKADDGVQFTQGVEFFTALRRLDKKVWMLQYDDGDHTVRGRDAIDFDTRMRQFFDYYLKGTPPPIWMTEGVATRVKGVESGLELDNSGREP